MSLLGSDYQINHFGGCGLPVLFFPGVPVAVGVRLRGDVVVLPTPLYNRSPLFFTVARKNFLWCRSAAPGGVSAAGGGGRFGASAARLPGAVAPYTLI